MNTRSKNPRKPTPGNVRVFRNPSAPTAIEARRTRLRRRKETAASTPSPPVSTPSADKVTFASTSSPGINDDAVYLTVKEPAELLRTTPRAIYSMIHRGQMPGLRRLGRRVLIARAELIAWVDACNAAVVQPSS